jgi:hypothetical protein
MLLGRKGRGERGGSPCPRPALERPGARLALPTLAVSSVKLGGPPQLARSRVRARVVSGTFPRRTRAEGHWLAASGAIKITARPNRPSTVWRGKHTVFSGRIE